MSRNPEYWGCTVPPKRVAWLRHANLLALVAFQGWGDKYFTNNELAVINMEVESTSRFGWNTKHDCHWKLAIESVWVAKALLLTSWSLKKYHLVVLYRQFAAFMKMLKLCMCVTPVQFEFHSITLDAFRWNVEENLNVRYMMSFCRSLAHNCYFCASWLDARESFITKDFVSQVWEPWNSWILIIWQLWWKNTLLEIYRCIREEIFIIPKRLERSMMEISSTIWFWTVIPIGRESILPLIWKQS
jgi:hypothetical protein